MARFSGQERRALAGATLLDLAVSPLFAWDVFTPVLRREIPAGEVALAAVFSAGLVAFTFGVLLGGRAADRIAPRRLAVLTAAGTGAGLLLSARAGSVPVLGLGYGVLLGAATGIGYATAVRIAGTVSARRGLALGLVVSAYAAGTIVLAPVAAALLPVLGRSGTLAVLAAILVPCLLVAAVLVPASPPERAPRRATPSFQPSRPVLGLWFIFGLGSAPAFAAFAHAGEIAGDPAAAALAVPLLSAGNFAGRLLAGPLSDRVGRPAALHADAAMLAIACLALVTGAAPLVLAALLVLGTQYGALSALTPAATSDAVPAQRYGASYGFVFTSWGVAGLVAPVGAAGLAAAGGFDLVFVVALGVAAVAWLAVAAFTTRLGDR